MNSFNKNLALLSLFSITFAVNSSLTENIQQRVEQELNLNKTGKLASCSKYRPGCGRGEFFKSQLLFD